MLSYQHIYHAGNMADVQKHLWLICVLDYLTKKDKPFLWIDTHAGRGLYDLTAPEAQKIKEYESGILKFYDGIKDAKDLPAPLARYRDFIKNLNKGTLTKYPGSAYLAAKIMRPTDKAFTPMTCIKGILPAFGKNAQELYQLDHAVRRWGFRGLNPYSSHNTQTRRRAD
ncbi:MAG: 23S rRNA (adenine(2030)-N(6))-methyltransferase RlmJ [Alphaproteobacteria bacterium]